MLEDTTLSYEDGNAGLTQESKLKINLLKQIFKRKWISIKEVITGTYTNTKRSTIDYGKISLSLSEVCSKKIISLHFLVLDLGVEELGLYVSCQISN